ncbi:MAG TPA: alkaline shock response membrane anchor protein AmaP [Limnochordales bacterium]
MHSSGYTAAAGRAVDAGAGYGLSFLDRAAVVLAALVVLCGGLAALAYSLLGPRAAEAAAASLPGWLAGGQWRLTALAAGVVLAVLGLAALRPALARPSERAIVRSTGLGEVRISVRAIQTLARRAASQVQGIREADVHVRPAAGGDVNVWVQLTVLPDESIPELCDEVQARVEQYLRQTAGVSCSRITVWVRGVAREARSPRLD